MSALWTKSRGAARSARLLLEAGDPDGAVNRAYYAMFGAARAALSTVRSALAHSKKHSTIVRRFDRHLVAERGFDRALGRGFLNRQRHARWVADYADASAEPAQAQAVVADMERLLAAIEPLVIAAAGRKRRVSKLRTPVAHQDAAHG
ncbi:MAG: HEPN domain-containing protein [Hyphomicrobiaceae bacterium]